MFNVFVIIVVVIIINNSHLLLIFWIFLAGGHTFFVWPFNHLCKTQYQEPWALKCNYALSILVILW